MKGKFAGKYRNKKGTEVFRYLVGGTDAQIAAFEKAQGDFLRKDENSGAPIYFSTKYLGDNINLLITSGGKVAVDDTNIAKVNSLATQYAGTALGDEFARQGVAMILGEMKSTPAPVSQPVAETSPDKA